MTNNNHFTLTLDTIAPTGTISVPPYVNSSNGSFAVTLNETSEPSYCKYMKVWAVLKGSSMTAPETPSWETFASSKTLTLTQNGTWVVHALYMDDVGNETPSDILSTEINFDNKKPIVSSVAVSDPTRVEGQPADETNSLTNNINIEGNDPTNGAYSTPSGIKSYTISCNAFASSYVVSPNSGSNYNGQISFKPGTQKGSYVITVTATDFAGNVSDTKTITLYYDPDASNVKLALYSDASRTTQIPSYSSNAKQYTNATSAYARINITLENGRDSADIVGYKIWTDEGTEPTKYTAVTSGTNPIDIPMISTGSDGQRTINVKVIDDSGNEHTLSQVIYKDTVKPTASLSISPAVISAVASNDSATLTYSVNDNIVIKSWNITINDTVLTNGTSAATNATQTIKHNTSGMQSGSNIIKLTVIDVAGNTYSTSTTLMLDMTAPTFTITFPVANTWYNASTYIGVSLANISKSAKAYAWVTYGSRGDSRPLNATAININPGNATISTSDIKDGNLAVDRADYYMNVQLVDAVGNESIISSVLFKYDATKPSTPVIMFSSRSYQSRDARITIFSATDVTSGIAQYHLYGDVTGSDTWIAWPSSSIDTGSYSVNVTLTSGDGIKSITVRTIDNAGNISDYSAEATCELDTSNPTGSLTLRNKGTTDPKDPISNVRDVDLLITIVDDNITTHGSGYYKVWGDFEGSDTREEPDDTHYVAFSTGGSTSITLSKTCTEGEGEKRFFARLKDNAGNISEVYGASPNFVSFYYDDSRPIVRATPDYTRISKITSARWSGANASIAGSACNKVVVTCNLVTEEGSSISSNEKYIAYKAVAYKDAAAAIAVVDSNESIENEEAIPGTSWLGAATAETISITILGENYENALVRKGLVAGSTAEGAHIVVIYVKDEGGNWSAIAAF